MSITLVCPFCGVRWKIVPDVLTEDKPARCPSCKPIKHEE